MRKCLLLTLAMCALTGCGDDSNANTTAIDASIDVIAKSDASDATSAAETAAPPQLPAGQVDRAGRPATNLIANHDDEVVRDRYNEEATFQDWSANTKYDAVFDRNLAAADALDGANDWTPDGGTSPLRELLKFDVLIVDTSTPCTSSNGFCESGYFEIENEMYLGGAAHKTCGGRTPGEDVMSKTLSLVVSAKLSGIATGAPRPSKPTTHTFPYLAEPMP